MYLFTIKANYMTSSCCIVNDYLCLFKKIFSFEVYPLISMSYEPDEMPCIQIIMGEIQRQMALSRGVSMIR